MKRKLLWKKQIIEKTSIIYGVYVDEDHNGEIVYKVYSANFLSDITLKRLGKYTEFLLGLDVVKDNLYIHIENRIPILLIKSGKNEQYYGVVTRSMYTEYIKYYMRKEWEELNRIVDCVTKEFIEHMTLK